MKKLIFILAGIVFALPVCASTNGEIAWTKLCFCNGAGYCVDVESKNGIGISALEISHDGVDLVIPKDAITIGDADAPLLNEMRLLSVQKSDGTFGNILELPYLSFPNGKQERSVLRLVFDARDSFVANP